MRKSLPSSLPKIGVVIDLVEKISPPCCCPANPTLQPLADAGYTVSSSSSAGGEGRGGVEKPGWRKKADCIGRRWKKEEKEGRTSKFGEEERGANVFSPSFFSVPCTRVYVVPLLRKGCMNTGTQHSAHTHDPEERERTCSS